MNPGSAYKLAACTACKSDESRLDTVDYGAELDVVIYGVELSATSNRTTKLDVVSHGVETCNLDAMNHGVDPQDPKFEFTSSKGLNVNFFKKNDRIVKNRRGTGRHPPVLRATTRLYTHVARPAAHAAPGRRLQRRCPCALSVALFLRRDADRRFVLREKH
jgi:hypothetical protein